MSLVVQVPVLDGLDSHVLLGVLDVTDSDDSGPALNRGVVEVVFVFLFTNGRHVDVSRGGPAEVLRLDVHLARFIALSTAISFQWMLWRLSC